MMNTLMDFCIWLRILGSEFLWLCPHFPAIAMVFPGGWQRYLRH